ncbi:uncharacterized protein LOC131259950 [Anopheles coustani]|uniref:uncharacterized protein LOC131259950 n=1 Tax=Anopheles coustani TaxID=139045 RepID=UPI00265A411A|nr:uncharacterized protein LOC131259950 [Anopheles coustani]
MPPTTTRNGVGLRPRRASRIDYASLNSVGEILIRQDTTTTKTNADFVTEIVPCSVLLKKLTCSELDSYGCTGLTGINPSKTGTSVTNKGSKTITRSNVSLSERFSNVTRRTKARRTENLPAVKQNETAKPRHTISIVDCSIISLDGSTNDSRMALKSQNLPSPKLTRRRASLTKTGAMEPQTKATEMSTENFQTSRSASKRKQESSVPDTGVSPPKKVLEDHVSIVEISIDREEGTAQEIIEHPTEATASTSTAQIKSLPKPDGNASKKLPIEPFKDLIVSVKRVGPAMTEAELRSLKYYDPDSAKGAINDDHRRSALGEDRKTIGQKKRSNRITFANKPQNVIASPIAEDPEPDSPKLDNNRTISGQRRRSIRLSLSAKLTPNDRVIDISSSLPGDPEPAGSKFDENWKLFEQKHRSSRPSLPTQSKATNRPIIISSPIAEDPEPIILEPPILTEIQTQPLGTEENHKNVLPKRRQSRSSMSTGSQIFISDLITEDPEPANSEQSMEMDSNSNKHSAEDNSAKQIEMKRRSSRLSFSNRPKLTNQQIVISSPIAEEPINLDLEVTQIDASLNSHSTDGTRNVIEQKRRVSSLSLATKPHIIVSAPIAESSAATDRSETDTNGNRLLPPAAKKVQKVKPSRLSYAIEEEENGEDVYEFHSCSQTSETLGQSKVRKKPGRKPKPKNDATKPVKKLAKKKKPSGTKTTVSWKPGHNNPFGCNRKQLANVIKHIGGGPVKPPVTVDYVVNLELPTTPHSTVDRGQQHNRDEIIDLPYHAASDLPKRVPTHPTVEKLKKGASLQQPKTSTPVIKLTEAAPTPPSNPVSPWRLQDDHIIPRTSYMPRNKEMLPSYDSFFVEENSTSAPLKPKAPVSLVTERRKPPSGARSVQVSKKDIQEVERMHRGLLAITEMSQRLITSMRRNKAVPGLQNCPEYEADVKEACVKLKQWYKSSKKDFHRSVHILNKIQRATDNDQMDSCPSPLTTDQQHTLECFNQSTDRFRTMIDEMQAAMNDSNVENCSPPSPPKQAKSSSVQQPSQQPSKVSDVIILPQRLTHGPTRNPLMPLNFVPLPQRTSPLISPLAVNDRGVASLAKENVPDSADNNIRRKLQYENTKENEEEKVKEKPPATEPFDKDTTKQRSVDTTVLDDVNHSANAILEVAAYEVVSDSNSSADTSCSIDNLFGFDEDEPSQGSSTQVTLPLPANISTKTLKQSLANVRQFIPKQPIFRRQPKPTPSTSGGPTRLPTVKLRVFGSPTKRPSHTLREFVASTPRAELSQLAATATTPIAGTSKSTQLLPVAATPQGQQAIALEAPDISAIESLNTTVAAKQHPSDGKEPEVVLFDTPEDSHINRSALHRTYTRVPRRRRKRKNVFLANLGLDDDEDDEDDEGAAGDDPVPGDSDSDVGSGNTRKRKDRTKKPRRKPKPVEETAEFKQFVEEFNSMCEVVERFQPIIE